MKHAVASRLLVALVLALSAAGLAAAQRDPAPSCGKRIKFITEQRKPDAVLNFLVNL
jgi:hypothetical protein